jgi:integrase
VPSVVPWRPAALPRSLEADQVLRLLASCDRETTVGRRDFAILLLLARLGLRRGEIAALALDDIDWRAGELIVPGLRACRRTCRGRAPRSRGRSPAPRQHQVPRGVQERGAERQREGGARHAAAG